MPVARALLLLGVGGLAFLSGATAQTCINGSTAVALSVGMGDQSCALLVSNYAVYSPGFRNLKSTCGTVEWTFQLLL